MRGSTPRRGASNLPATKGSFMSRFCKKNFERIIAEIEKSERKGDNYWLPIGILEIMYDDDCGYIDEYFEKQPQYRDSNELWYRLQLHIEMIEGDDLK